MLRPTQALHVRVMSFEFCRVKVRGMKNCTSQISPTEQLVNIMLTISDGTFILAIHINTLIVYYQNQTGTMHRNFYIFEALRVEHLGKRAYKIKSAQQALDEDIGRNV